MYLISLIKKRYILVAIVRFYGEPYVVLNHNKYMCMRKWKLQYIFDKKIKPWINMYKSVFFEIIY